MPSFKSRFFNLLLRNRHVLQGKFKKEVFDFNTSIEGFRELCEKGAAKYAKIPENISVKPEVIEGINSEWLIPKDSSPDKVILYVHGGGYVSGSCNDHRGFVSKFAAKCNYKTLQYEYRLAPEHPYPAALDDSVKIYKWLVENGFKSNNILIAGESAGGGLTLALLLALRDQQIELPVAAVAISPWTDLTCSSESYKTKGKVSLAPTDSWLVFGKHYYGEQSPKLPYISPLFGDLKNLPPLFINSGDADELFEDGEKFAKKATAAGVDVTFVAGKDMVHCYPLLAPFFKEATEALDEICAFVNKYLK